MKIKSKQVGASQFFEELSRFQTKVVIYYLTLRAKPYLFIYNFIVEFKKKKIKMKMQKENFKKALNGSGKKLGKNMIDKNKIKS